ncbi:MAG: hypothetical protein AB7F99_19110 [Vicinamibacterales bacterium]
MFNVPLAALVPAAKAASGILDAAGYAGLGLASLALVCGLLRWLASSIIPIVLGFKATAEAHVILADKLERCIDRLEQVAPAPKEDR